MGKVTLLAAVFVVLGVVVPSQGYILQFESYDGQALASGYSAGSDEGEYEAEVSWMSEDGWCGSSAGAYITDLSEGGGTGAGTYKIGESSAGAYSWNDYSHGQTGATYTWRLLSEYGNTGTATVTVHLEATGMQESHGGWGEGYVRIESTLDWCYVWVRDAEGYACLDRAFEVPIGGTISVGCACQATSGNYGIDTWAGGGSCNARVEIPEEVPEPGTMALIAFGGLALLRRRG